MWCNLGKPITCCKWWNCKIKEINITILMFFFIFYSLWTSVTFDASIRGDPSKKFWKENQMIPITQNTNFAPCDGFSQITSQIVCAYKQGVTATETWCRMINFRQTVFFLMITVLKNICVFVFHFHVGIFCRKMKASWRQEEICLCHVVLSFWCGKSVKLFVIWLQNVYL